MKDQKIPYYTPASVLKAQLSKENVAREDFELFRDQLAELATGIKHAEQKNVTEEHFKKLISDFLNNTFYKEYHLNTRPYKGNIETDLAIYGDKEGHSQVNVLFEVKKPSNKAEMITAGDLNRKALQEAILYYLYEKTLHENHELTHIVITNGYEWFIFDAAHFHTIFYEDTALLKHFRKWKAGSMDSNSTTQMQDTIGKFITNNNIELPYTWFHINEYLDEAKTDEKKLLSLYKLLSPRHLLKLPFSNDSNTLNRSFYNELLHIIGLEEQKDKGKKLIRRRAKPDLSAMLESAIMVIRTEGRHRQVSNLSEYGQNEAEQLFNIALELCITWVNRVLFLKLLEGQLIRYHKDKRFAFLNKQVITEYDDLNALFFRVLAIRPGERDELHKDRYAHIPYLNSSLFEPTTLERETISISSLEDRGEMDIMPGSVLRDADGKPLKNAHMRPLHYLLDFLDSYDFGADGSAVIQEKSKAIINAAVLGLIFEKINGYRDGSFFTPGFITMYMCRETIRRAVLDKFNMQYNWQCADFEALQLPVSKLNVNDANALINSLKICDPAVGSGHFLVSALNELIAIKSELGLLCDNEGKRLLYLQVSVENDELVIIDDNGGLYDYQCELSKPPSLLQRKLNTKKAAIQEMLFREKQLIIENCLFGVDINPNSVKICRLRLWIELLKNAYYTSDSGYTELHTLPNIDINIKQGNSLLSRFKLDDDLGDVFRKQQYSLETYKTTVEAYKNTNSRTDKDEYMGFIQRIKEQFRTALVGRDPINIRLSVVRGEVTTLENPGLFGEKGDPKKLEAKRKELEKLEAEKEEIISNRMYSNAFEWRFEFPEVLDEQGRFIGFDVVIGNPPYIRVQDLEYKLIDFYKDNFQVALKRVDISIMFIELSEKILKSNGKAGFITSNQFLTTEYGAAIRKFLKDEYQILKIIDFGDLPIFEAALTYVSMFFFQKGKPDDFEYCKVNSLNQAKELKFYTHIIEIKRITLDNWILSSDVNIQIIEKLKMFPTLRDFGKAWAGLFTGLDKYLMFNIEEVKKFGFEEEIVLPVLRAQDCSKYYCKQPTKYTLYPYKFENGKTILLEEEELRSLYPIAYDYLLKHKNEILARKDSRQSFQNKKGWFSLTRFGQKNVYNQIKIVSPGEVKEHKFCIDRSKSGFSCARVFAITLNENTLDLRYVLAILNSSTSRFFIQSRASLKAGGYYTYSSNVLNLVPIKWIMVDEQMPFIKLTQVAS